MAGLTDIIESIRDKDGSAATRKLLSSIDRKLDDDAYDSTRALHKVERNLKNRAADKENDAKVKFVKGESKSALAEGSFEDDEVTKLYVDSLKDVVGEVHTMTRDEMKNNIVRMKGLMQQIGESTSDDLKEKDFLQEQYKNSLQFMEAEYTKRSAVSTRAFAKIGELSEQYLDLQSMYAGLVDNNPVAMALFKVTSDVVGGFRKRKMEQKKMLAEDIRRKRLATIFDKDKKKDFELEKKRNEKLAAAQDEAVKASVEATLPEEAAPTPGPSTPPPVSTEATNEPAEAFAGFAFPDDEYSNTGDAALSSADMEGIFGATGGAFTRDHDAEAEAERQEAMEFMRSKNSSAETEEITAAVDDSSEKLVAQQDRTFERIDARANEDERERDEWESETKEYQQGVIERLDKIVSNLERNGETFTKMSGGSGEGGGMFGDIAGAVGPGILAKIAGKFAKPLKMVAKFAAPAVAASAALLSKVGLGKVGGKLTEKFGGMTAKALGGDVAKEITKEGVSKVAKEGAIKGATKVSSKAAGAVAGKASSKAAGKLGTKALGKSLLKKIPGIGLLAGIGFGVDRLMDGDITGAGLEVLSGAASIIPGFGTAASIAIDAGLVARDMGAFESGSEESLGLEKSAKEGEKGLEKVVAEKKRKYDKAMSSVESQIANPQAYMQRMGGSTNLKRGPQSDTDRLGIDMEAGAIASGLAPTRSGRSGVPDYIGTGKKADRFGEAQQHLSKASSISGVDAGTLAKITNIESGFNSNAQPISRNSSANKYAPKGTGGKKGISSAHGYGQFLNSTWEEQVKKHGSKYGVKGTGKDGAITSEDAFSVRQDKEVQAGMLAEYSKQGIDLGEKYGAGNNDANVYAHHNLGPGGAKRLFKGLQDNPDARLDSVLKGDEIKNNPSLYKKNMTVKEAYANLGKKMSSGDKFANAMGSPSLTPAPITAAKLEPVAGKSVQQTGRLEQGIVENKVAQDKKNMQNALTTAAAGRSVSKPSKQGIAHQDRGLGRTTQPSGTGSARNSDSTIQRITDRWMSHSFA